MFRDLFNYRASLKNNLKKKFYTSIDVNINFIRNSLFDFSSYIFYIKFSHKNDHSFFISDHFFPQKLSFLDIKILFYFILF